MLLGPACSREHSSRKGVLLKTFLENGVLLGTFPERISEARIARHGLPAGLVTRMKDSEDLEAGS